MKHYFAALSATALISLAPYALASSTDLTVTGTITPQACTPGFSGGGVVDYGKLLVKNLNTTEPTELADRDLQLNLTCGAPTLVALKVIDNRPYLDIANYTYFGMTLTPAGEKPGYFYLDITQTLADGASAQSIYSIDGGTTWKAASAIYRDDLWSVSSTTDHTKPIMVNNATMDLRVKTVIHPTDSFTLIDDITLDGSATFEVVYL
jgi:hypothetical protein